MNQLLALGLTLACEVPLLVTLTRPRPQLRVLLVAVSASLLTHPLAWCISLLLSPQEYGTGLLMIEAIVVVVEAFWLQAWLRAGLPKSFAWSLLANAASFLLGYLLFAL